LRSPRALTARVSPLSTACHRLSPLAAASELAVRSEEHAAYTALVAELESPEAAEAEGEECAPGTAGNSIAELEQQLADTQRQLEKTKAKRRVVAKLGREVRRVVLLLLLLLLLVVASGRLGFISFASHRRKHQASIWGRCTEATGKNYTPYSWSCKRPGLLANTGTCICQNCS
jgi:cytochrome c-type biogenesis protein CcmH/NrfG